MKEIESSGGSKERRATARTAHKEKHRGETVQSMRELLHRACWIRSGGLGWVNT
jgi:hypothetical protein